MGTAADEEQPGEFERGNKPHLKCSGKPLVGPKQRNDVV